jgi:hypothetical protein
MHKTIKSNCLASAVFAALPALTLLSWSSSVQAQYQIQGGHVLDANNRIGSGGYNGGGAPRGEYNNINNNIVTGNVSGLNYFHGNKTVEFDSNTFQGPTNDGAFENFNAISAPVNNTQRYTGVANSTATPYYSTDRVVGGISNNFVPTSNNTGLVPAPYVSPLTPTGYDSRVGLTNVDPTKGNLLTQGELDMSGPVDPSTGTQSIYSMSPLFGVRQSDAAGTQQDSFFMSKTIDLRSKNPAGRSTMTPGEIQQMRDELNKTMVPDGQMDNGPINNGQQKNGDVTTPAAQDSVNSPALSNAVTSDKLPSARLNSSVTNQPINAAVSGNAESMQNTLLIPPAKQSKQLAELEKRFANNQKLNDVQATDKFNAEKRAQNNPSNVGGPNTATDFSKEGGAAKNNTAVNAAPKTVLTKPDNTAPSTIDNQPYVVTSLAAGITAKGLAGLMKTAEDKMREGKYTEAVDTYDTAEQVAPNNAFVMLGRGLAELGASYYGKADLDISHAIAIEPAVLAGRYDLKGFLGEDRVKFVHDDLEDIANHEKGARPLVLLAFVAHNSGDDALAAKDLNEAAKRGGYAELVKQMRQAWNLK